MNTTPLEPQTGWVSLASSDCNMQNIGTDYIEYALATSTPAETVFGFHLYPKSIPVNLVMNGKTLYVRNKSVTKGKVVVLLW